MAVIKTIIRVTDALSATIVSVANLIVLFTNTAGANEKIDDRLLLRPPGREAHPGFSPERAQKKQTTFRLSSSYPLRGSTALLQ